MLLPRYSLLLPLAAALVHFYADAGTRRCFYKELEHGALLLGRYKLEIQDPDSLEYYVSADKLNIGVVIDVEEKFDADHRVVHQKGSSLGRFAFNALSDGEHRICFSPRSFHKKWSTHHAPQELKEMRFVRARIAFEIVVGDGSLIDSRVNGKVDAITERVHRLNDKLVDIQREQKFVREKEAAFRDISERVCDRVLRWSLIQGGALVLLAVYQFLTYFKFLTKEKQE